MIAPIKGEETGMDAFSPPVMPTHPAPHGVGINLLVTVLIALAILAWWAFSNERKRGPILPLLMVGTGLACVAVEAVFDNIVLYWWPSNNPYALYSSFGRNVPWSAVIAYGWYFSGVAYFQFRRFEHGVTMRGAILLYLFGFAVDWLAMSVAEWTGQSGFYGNQPYHMFGNPLWFSFMDAAGAFAIAVATYGLAPHLKGWHQLLFIIMPTYVYGGVLGAISAPVGQAINSGWSETAIWSCATVTIAMCWLLVYVLSRIVVATSALRAR